MVSQSEPATPSNPPAVPLIRNRNLWAVTLTSLLTDVSSDMLFTLLPLFLSNVLGVRTSVIGLIEGVAETTSSLLKGVSGWLSDRLRARKWLTVAGYGLSTVSKPLLYFATTWAAVLGVRFADRVGKGIRTAPRDALIADSIDPAHRGIAFSIHRAGDTFGAMLGLILALVVVLAMQSQAVSLARETFQTLALISLIPAALAVLVLIVGARDVPVKPAAGKTRLTLGALGPRFRGFLLIVVIFALGNSADAFLILRAQERGLSVAGVLGMLITFNLIYAVFAGPAGAISDRIGRQRVIRFGWLVYALLYLGFAVASEAWQIWALYALYGLYYAATEGVSKALVADIVPAAQRGTAYGYYNAAIGLAALPASVLAGLLWQGIGGWTGFGPSAPFVAGAALALVASLLLMRWQRRGQTA